MASNTKSEVNKKEQKQLAPRYDPDYYRLPSPLLGSAVLFPTAFLVGIAVAPNCIPESIWPLSQLADYLTTNHLGFITKWNYCVLFTHLIEASYAGKICHERKYNFLTTLKWMASVFVVGFPSMMKLKEHEPEKQD